MATPPARVEFCTWTMLNLLCLETKADTANEMTQLAAIDNNVLMMALRCSSPFRAAPLNDGQNSQRNIVPIFNTDAFVSFRSIWAGFAGDVYWIGLMRALVYFHVKKAGQAGLWWNILRVVGRVYYVYIRETTSGKSCFCPRYLLII